MTDEHRDYTPDALFAEGADYIDRRIKLYAGFVKVVNTPRYLVYMGLTVFGTATIVFRLLEPVSLFNAFYWSIITGMGVGYGDFTPHHLAGKIEAIMLAITTMIFYIPMIVASIASRLIVDRNAFTDAEQEELKHDMREIIRKLNIPPNIEEEKRAGE